MHRIIVIGSPGAGKSTLAHALASSTGLPLYHLDRIHWLAGWQERDRDDALADVQQVLGQERWIIDGNYGSTLPIRIKRADVVVWLDYPTRHCLGRVLRRWWQYRGRNRPDMTEGCPERLDFGFLLYVVNFRSSWHARNAAALADFEGEVIRLRSPAESEVWLSRQGAT
jgi:adenylate kinase family enzyme